MAGTFKFELVTPERMALSEDAGQVVVPGVEGEFTVLAGPCAVHLRASSWRGRRHAGRCRARSRVFVKGGFAEVDADRLTVLAERAWTSKPWTQHRPPSCRPPRPISPPPPTMPTGSPPLPPSSN